MTEHAYGNIFVRKSRYHKAGDVVAGHEHHFDHLTYFPAGSWKVEKWVKVVDHGGQPSEDKPVYHMVAEKTFDAGSEVFIEANARHRFTALEDGSRYDCIYAHRTPQGDVVQHYTGWGPAYG